MRTNSFCLSNFHIYMMWVGPAIDVYTFIIHRLSWYQFRCLSCIFRDPPLFLAVILLLPKFLGLVIIFLPLYGFLLLSPLNREETCNLVSKIFFNLLGLYYVAVKYILWSKDEPFWTFLRPSTDCLCICFLPELCIFAWKYWKPKIWLCQPLNHYFPL